MRGNNHGRHAWRRAFAGALVAVAAAAPTAVDAASTPIVIPDGEYHGVIVGTSTVGVAGAGGGSATFNGEMSMSVDAGEVGGEFLVQGFAVMSGPDSYGTGDYESTGVMAGTAVAPLVRTTNVSIHMVMTVNGHTAEQTVDLPGGDEWTLDLTLGDCGVIIGRWSVSAEGMTGEGTVVLTPTVDMTPESTDYLLQGLTLQDDVDAYTTAVSVGSAPPHDLAALVERASALRQSMRRNEECGLRPADELVDIVLANAIEQLLRSALANPDAFSDLDLQMLTNAAADHGLVGPSSPGGGANALGDALSAEWHDRLDGFIAAGDSLGIDIAWAVGEALGDIGLVEDAAAAAEALGSGLR